MNLIVHVEIPVLDIERAIGFYSAVFGVNFGEVVTIHGNKMAFFPFEADQNGASAALAQGDVYVPTRDGAIIYIGVSDMDDVLAKAVALGSEVLFPKTLAGENIYVAEIADSEGNRIAVQSV